MVSSATAYVCVQKFILWLVTYQLSHGDEPGANALGLANILSGAGTVRCYLNFQIDVIQHNEGKLVGPKADTVLQWVPCSEGGSWPRSDHPGSAFAS